MLDAVRDVAGRLTGKPREQARIVEEKLASAIGDVNLENENTAQTDGERYAIIDGPKGKFVRADRQVIFGSDPESWREQAENYINGKIRKGEDLRFTTDDGEVVTVTSKTAGKSTSPYNSDGTKMTDEEYETKINASVHIDELVQVSKYNGWKADYNGKHGDFAKNGWSYRTVWFEDFDGKMYRLRLSFALSDTDQTTYNIGGQRRRSPSTSRGSSVEDGAQSGETPSKDMVTQNKFAVKENDFINSDTVGVLRDEFTATRDEREISELDEMARRLGLRVQFVDGISTPKGTADASIKGNVVKIDKNTTRPYLKLMGHEVTHHLQAISPEAYAKFEKLALKQLGNGYIENVFNRYNSNGVKLDPKGIIEEAVADYAGSLVYDGKVLDKFISDNRSDRGAMRNLLSAVRSIKDKLFGNHRKQVEVAETKLTDAIGDVNLENKNTAQTDGERYAIIDGPKGKFVRADRQVILGNDPESWREQAENYINDKIRKGKDVKFVTDDGKTFTVSAKTVGKITNPFAPSGEPLSDDAYETKINAAIHVDELIKASEHNGWAPDKDNSHGDFAKNGWDYRYVWFEDFDGQKYRMKLSFALGKEDNTAYNIGEMNRRSSSTQFSGLSAKNGAHSGEASSTDMVSQPEPAVKEQFSIKRDSSLSGVAEEAEIERAHSAADEILESITPGVSKLSEIPKDVREAIKNKDKKITVSGISDLNYFIKNGYVPVAKVLGTDGKKGKTPDSYIFVRRDAIPAGGSVNANPENVPVFGAKQDKLAAQWAERVTQPDISTKSRNLFERIFASIKNAGHALRREWVSGQIDLERAGKMQNEFMPNEANMEDAVQMARVVGGTVDFVLSEGLTNKDGDIVGDSFSKVISEIPAKEFDAVQNYMNHQHNIARAANGEPVLNATVEESRAEVERIETLVAEGELSFDRYKDIGGQMLNAFADKWRTWRYLVFEKLIYNNVGRMCKLAGKNKK